MTRFYPIAVVALLLAGCGSAGTGGNNSIESGFDKGFRDSFKEKFVEQCVAGAQRTSGTTRDFSAVCGCVADKTMAGKSVAQLMGGPSEQEAKDFAAQCQREHPMS
jgi:hypothetical protein